MTIERSPRKKKKKNEANPKSKNKHTQIKKH